MNKLRERFYLEKFLSHRKLLQSSKIVDFEKPDFVVELDGKTLGVEETQYHQGISATGSPAKEQEVIWNKILEHAPTSSGGGARRNFTGLVFTNSELPKRGDQPALLAELDGLVTNYKSLLSSGTVEIKAGQLRHLKLSRYVRKLVLIPTRSVRGVKWERAESIAGSVGFSESELREILKNKRKTVDGYDRSRFDELWLLIVATGESNSSTGTILQSLLEALAQQNQQSLSGAGFDKIWYYSFLPEFCVRMFP